MAILIHCGIRLISGCSAVDLPSAAGWRRPGSIAPRGHDRRIRDACLCLRPTQLDAIRSGIVAGFLGLMLTGGVSTWALTTAGLGINWLVAVAQFLCSCYGSRGCAPAFGSLSAHRLVALDAAGPFVGHAGPGHRHRHGLLSRAANSTPGSGFEPAEYAAEVTPKARQTADMYTRAGRASKPRRRHDG